jgi:NAD+ diphosphatase
MRVIVVDAQTRALIRDDDAGPHLSFSDDVEPQFFLGLDDDGVAYAASVGDLKPRIDARPMSLVEVGAMLDDRDAGLLTHAVALTNWHAAHTHCPR